MKKDQIYPIHSPFIKDDENVRICSIIYRLLDYQLMEIDSFYQTTIRRKIDPIITCIIDQNRSTSGGSTCLKNPFPESRRYYVFINNFEGSGYIELEIGMYWNGIEYILTDFDFSDHGYPASYGYTIYSYDPKTGVQEFDKSVF